MSTTKPNGTRTRHHKRKLVSNVTSSTKTTTKGSVLVPRGKRNQAGAPKKLASSKFRGVTWNKWHQKWTSQIRYNGKQHHLGVFVDPAEAAAVYDAAATKHHGSKAVLNFPTSTAKNGRRSANGNSRNNKQKKSPQPQSHSTSEVVQHQPSPRTAPLNHTNRIPSHDPIGVPTKKVRHTPSLSYELIQDVHRQNQLQRTLHHIRNQETFPQSGSLTGLGLRINLNTTVPTTSLLHPNYAYNGGDRDDTENDKSV